MRGWLILGMVVTTASLAGTRAAQAEEPGSRKLAPLPHGVPPTPENREVARLNTEAAQLLTRGRPSDALMKAEAAIGMDPKSEWGHYQRGAALAGLGRTEEAVKAYQKAESLTPRDDAWGRSLAMWGRAQTLRQAGRCDEAKSAYNEYIAQVRSSDVKAAEQAAQQASACKTASERALEDRVAGPPPPRAAEPASTSPPAIRGILEPPRAPEPALPEPATKPTPATKEPAAAEPATPAPATQPATPPAPGPAKERTILP